MFCGTVNQSMGKAFECIITLEQKNTKYIGAQPIVEGGIRLAYIDFVKIPKVHSSMCKSIALTTVPNVLISTFSQISSKTCN